MPGVSANYQMPGVSANYVESCLQNYH